MCLCVCVHDFRWSDCLSLKSPVCRRGHPEIKKSKRENAEQPRAVLASKRRPPIFLRQILVSVNMASKVKAWLRSNKCSMCMPWVNDVNVIFISSEYNSIHYCLVFLFVFFLLLLVWKIQPFRKHLCPLRDQSAERWAAIGQHEQMRLLNSGRGVKTTSKILKIAVKVWSDWTRRKSPHLTLLAQIWLLECLFPRKQPNARTLPMLARTT